MKYFIDRQLKKKLEKPEYVWLTKQLARFADEVEKVKGYMNALPSGFWVRKIVGTEIYKFRLNNGDRMLFCFTEKHNELDKAVVFLDYCTHDQQVYTAQRTNKHFKVPQNIAVAPALAFDDKEDRFDQSVAHLI